MTQERARTSLRWLLALTIVAATASVMDATTLLSLRREDRIVIAADTALMLIREASTASAGECKLFVGPRVAIAVGGLASVKDRNGQVPYDLHQDARDVVAKAKGVNEALKMIQSKASDVHAGIPYALKTNTPDLYRRIITRSDRGTDYGTVAGFLVVGLEGDGVSMASMSLDFAIRSGPVPFNSVKNTIDLRVCPRQCPADGVPFVIGLRNGVDARLSRTDVGAAGDIAQQATLLLEAQTAVSRGAVAPPFAMAEVTRTAVKWLQQPAVCK